MAAKSVIDIVRGSNKPISSWSFSQLKGEIGLMLITLILYFRRATVLIQFIFLSESQKSLEVSFLSNLKRAYLFLVSLILFFCII